LEQNSSTYLAGRAMHLAMSLSKQGKLIGKDGAPICYKAWAQWFSEYLTWDKAQEKLEKIVNRLEAMGNA
jgi:hypothetical protein